MTEEFVTKAFLRHLVNRQWNIVCFDFPQSGTGRLLHPNRTAEKNKGSINPDIVAVKNGVCLFFENKDRYYYSDYIKQNSLITDNNYTDAIQNLLINHNVRTIKYGIGLPCSSFKGAAIANQNMVDFIFGVTSSGEIRLLYNPDGIII